MGNKRSELPLRHHCLLQFGHGHGLRLYRTIIFGETAILTNLRIALYQPDIPGNTGTILRMAACLGLAVDIVEPAGFDMSDRALRRAGMDYTEQAVMTRHRSWNHFHEWSRLESRRLILATTKAEQSFRRFEFEPDDILLFGRESAGVPDDVHRSANARTCIPMVEGRRSLNLAISAALITGEALRQTMTEQI